MIMNILKISIRVKLVLLIPENISPCFRSFASNYTPSTDQVNSTLIHFIEEMEGNMILRKSSK